MAHTQSLRGRLSSTRNLAIALIFLSQSLWAQAPATSTALPGNSSTLKLKKEETDEQPARKYSGAVKVTTVGRGVDDETLKSRVGWTFVEAGVDTEFTDWLGFNIGVVGVFGEGAAQNYLTDEGAGSSNLFLDYASLNIKPWKPVTLKAGLIGYQINPIYTTMSPSTSVGAEEKVEFGTSDETFKVTVSGNQVIPSTGMGKGLVEQDANPFFTSASLMGEIDAKLISTKFKAAYSQFRFGNLPLSVAKDSLTAGNSPDSVTGSGENMDYVIGFAGSETAANIETDWTSRIRTTLKGVFIRNDRAFRDTNEGRMGRFELRLLFGNIAIKPVVTIFEIEADTTPANYTILPNRYNNRKGQTVGMNVELIKQKFTFFGNYTKADEILASPYISDREIYQIGVEVNYDLF